MSLRHLAEIPGARPQASVSGLSRKGRAVWVAWSRGKARQVTRFSAEPELPARWLVHQRLNPEGRRKKKSPG